MNKQDSPSYLAKKKKLNRTLTIYGRKPVLEALTAKKLHLQKLHLADSNKPAEILDRITTLAERQQLDIQLHDKKALSRISKNSKQDQGVALDIFCPDFLTLEDFLTHLPEKFSLIALDNIVNPVNLGMIIRSVTASPSTGILLPQKGCAKIDSLVIKGSAGTIFNATLIRCENLLDAMIQLKSLGTHIVAMDASGDEKSLKQKSHPRELFIVGNETDGVSQAIKDICDTLIRIPMENNIESLNVSIAASLIAFKPLFISYILISY